MRLVLSTGEVLFCLCAVVLALYASPLFIDDAASPWEFLQIWDDKENFLDNDVIQSGLGLKNLYAMFTMTKINVYEPFGWLSKAVQVQIVGLNSWCIRLVTVALHFAALTVLAGASAVLLDVIALLSELKAGAAVGGELQRSRERRHWYGCCISAVVFAIHPVHVEVVGWPSAQPYAQCALLSNLALYVYVKEVYRKLCEVTLDKKNTKATLMSSIFSGHGRSELLYCVLYLTALLSKSVCILLPAGFFLVDVLVYATLRLPRPGANELWTYITGKLPVAATLLTFLAVMLLSNYNATHPDTDVLSLTLTERLIKAAAMPVWILRQIVWPTKLRPHYQLRPGELSLTNADYLLSVSAFVALVLFTLWLFQHRNAPQHLLALAYFTIMMLPVSGLIQHGMISAGCDRYAYFCSVAAVPYGGAALTRRLFDNSRNDVKVPGDDKPQRAQTRNERHQRLFDMGVVLLFMGVLLSISTSLMNNWRNESALFEYSLRLDPTDWRILDQQAAHFIDSQRCKREDDECRRIWELSYHFTPRGTLKSDLQRLKLLVWLGNLDAACEGYRKLLELRQESCHVHNNAGVCLFRQGEHSEARREFERALQTPGYEHMYDAPRANLKRLDKWLALKEDARTRGEEDNVPQLDVRIMF